VAVKKTKAGAILKQVLEDDWKEYGYVLEGVKKRKTFMCVRCSAVNIRGNNRKFHKCESV
jgi:hypothetical protein